MSLDVNIFDGTGTKNKVKVTSRGQMVVAPLAFSEPYFNAMTVDDQVYNFITPINGQQFIITDILASGDKSVSSSTGVEIIIYESASADGVSTKTLFTLNVNRLENVALIGLNLIISTGVWLNATMDDNNVNLTILGYYVDIAT